MAIAERQAAIPEQWSVNKYLWLCLLFIAAFIPVANGRGWITVPLPVAYSVLGMAVVNGALRTYFGWRGGGTTGVYGWWFTFVDVMLISLGVHLTGGIRSELWVVYFVLMISESLFAGPTQTAILLAAIMAGYLGATWPTAAPGPNLDYAVAITIRLFFVLVVGSFARRLGVNQDRRNREVLRLGEEVAASEERARIAREVHDGLGHALVQSILRLELCSRLIRRDPAEAEHILHEEVPALRAAWNEGRDLAFHLRPWSSAHDGCTLIEGLRRHLSRFAERTGIATSLEVEQHDLALPANRELALTRIIQEALTNVARHSHAANAVVRVAKTGTTIRCEISDDGVGFAPSILEPAGCFGLSAMRERAEQCGGQLSVDSRPERGVTITVTL